MTGKTVLYTVHRAGVGQEPTFIDNYDACEQFFASVFHWNRRIRILHADRCPPKGPVIFVGNHLLAEDPFLIFHAVYTASRKSITPRFMMRDDFGANVPPLIKWLDMNGLSRMGGAFHISRGDTRLTQLKPFINLLREGGSFIMFPGGTRSRSGMFYEYRDGINEPGGVSFFMSSLQKGANPVQVKAVPVVRTYNLIDKKSTLIFGHPVQLQEGADRADQKRLDAALVTSMAKLMEVNFAQLTSIILYDCSLHHLPATFPIKWLLNLLLTLAQQIDHPYKRLPFVAIEEELTAILLFFQNHQLLSLNGQNIQLHQEAILALPSLTGDFKKDNPIRYFANQIMHLPNVIGTVENLLFKNPPVSPIQ